MHQLIALLLVTLLVTLLIALLVDNPIIILSLCVAHRFAQDYDHSLRKSMQAVNE